MDAGRSSVGWGFWWLWVLFNFLGYGFGVLTGFLLIGALVGFLQWLLLRRLIPHSAWWIASTAIGFFVPFGLYGIAWLIWRVSFDPGWPMGGLGWAACFLVGGALMGVLQLRVLRRRVAEPRSWVFYSAIGWCSSVFPMMLWPDMSGDLPSPLFMLRYAVMLPAFGGVLLGAITGIGMMRLLRRQPA